MKTTIDMAETISHGWWLDDEKLKAFEALVRADEREACAKVCDRIVEGKDPDDIHSDSQWAALSLAAEIRNRGNT
jgi:hypothetical protein